MATLLFSGRYRFNLLPDKHDMEYRDIVKGMRAIWKRIACLDPNRNGGMILLAQYLDDPGTTVSCCPCHLITA